MKELTARQEAILGYIKEYQKDNGYPPTLREMGKFFNINSTNGVNDHLVAIEKKGYIKRNREKSRAIELLCDDNTVSDDGSIRQIPVLGRIAAGTPLLAVENVESHLKIDNSLISSGEDIYALNVKGDSMIGDHIQDGDYVLLKKVQDVENPNDIAAVLIDDEVTLKRVNKFTTKVELIASNPAVEPIIIRSDNAKNVTIVGKMVGLIRKA